MKKISTKTEKLIQILSFTPSEEDAEAELIIGKQIDRKQFAMTSLIEALETISKGTINEEITQEIIKKAKNLYGIDEFS